jgi:hypothetical protein
MAFLSENYDVVGDVDIKQLYLVPGIRGREYEDLKQFLVELNIYESIFSPFITGSLILSDSINLPKLAPILGDELLIIQLLTPSMNEKFSIFKTFKINSIKDKIYTDNGLTQLYKITFSSIEMFADVLSPVTKSFKGSPHELVKTIYTDYLSVTRNLNVAKRPDPSGIDERLETLDSPSPLTILTETENVVNFVSPNWTPVKCINWLCGQSKSSNSKANNFLFWETTKGFYYGTFNDIFKDPLNFSIGKYTQNVTSEGAPRDDSTSSDIARKVFNIKTSKVEQTFDQLENVLTGYLASRVVDIDLYNKTYLYEDYDHISNYVINYSHSNGNNSVPILDVSTTRNPLVYQTVNYNIPKLFSSSLNNFSEIKKDIYGNRRSNLLELTNFRKEIVIPGRTDIECGSLIEIDIIENKVLGDSIVTQKDELYSGFYLITALTHKINLSSHFITMEISKDSIFAE